QAVSAAKRSADDISESGSSPPSQGSRSSKRRSSTRQGQAAFRDRLEERDKKTCVVSGSATCDAAHIIPVRFAEEYQ
ncbi:hypothetical protein HDV05_001042, partial [Chytridiales sp. JEL 0842]